MTNARLEFRRIVSFLLLLALGGAGQNARGDQEPVTLTLKEVARRVREGNADVRVAREKTRETLERLGQAQAALLPQITAGASQSRQTRNLEAQGIVLPRQDPKVGPFNTFDLRVKLSQILFDGVSLQRIQAARAEEALAEAEQRQAEETAFALAAVLYIQAKREQALLGVAEAIVHQEEERRRLAETRRAAGTGSRLEGNEARAALALRRQEQNAAAARARNARRDLAASLGWREEQTFRFGIDEDIEKMFLPSEEEIAGAALNHPSVVSARRSLDALDASRRAARAETRPKLAASADIGLSGKTPSDSLATYAYGAQFSVPVFEGGRARRRDNEFESRRRSAETRLADIERRVETEARNARDLLENAHGLRAALLLERDLAVEQRALARKRESLGVGTAFDRLVAETRFLLAQDRVDEAESAVRLAEIQTAKALGRMDSLLNEPEPNE